MLRTLDGCQQGIPSSQSTGSDVGSPSWTALKTQAYSVFETMQALLSVPSFVAVTQELLQHQVRLALATSGYIINSVRSCDHFL